MGKIIPVTFEQDILLRGELFGLVKIQRDEVSAVYKSEDKTKILRIGDKNKIENDLTNHKNLFQQGYPVSEIIEDDEYNHFRYFVEKSLGENLFAQIFKNEYEKFGKISDNSFELLVSESKKLLLAQIKNSTTNDHTSDTEKGIHLEWILDELPELKDEIVARFTLALKRLEVFPFVFLHGDYCPYNVFPNGVIDFEDGFYGPTLFDVYGLMVYLNYFPMKDEVDLEINGRYTYTEEQRKRYFEEMDNVLIESNLPKGSDYFEEILFLKGVWLTLKMHRWPKLQEYRYKIFKELL